MRRHAAQPYRTLSAYGSVLLAVIGGLLLSALPAAAHNVLVSSNPAAGAVLAHAPNSITLVFDQDVENVYAEMAITIGSQPPVEFTPQIIGPDVTADLASEQLAIPTGPTDPSDRPEVPGLTAWKIGYRIVSADGHPVSGLVDFSVGTAGATGTPDPGTPVAAGGHGPRSGPPWSLIAGIAVLLGAAAAIMAIIRRRRGTAT